MLRNRFALPSSNVTTARVLCFAIPNRTRLKADCANIRADGTPEHEQYRIAGGHIANPNPCLDHRPAENLEIRKVGTCSRTPDPNDGSLFERASAQRPGYGSGARPVARFAPVLSDSARHCSTYLCSLVLRPAVLWPPARSPAPDAATSVSRFASTSAPSSDEARDSDVRVIPPSAVAPSRAS